MEYTLTLDELGCKQLNNLKYQLSTLRGYEVGDDEAIAESVELLFNRFQRAIHNVIHITVNCKIANPSAKAELIEVLKELEQQLEQKLEVQMNKVLNNALQNIRESRKNLLTIDEQGDNKFNKALLNHIKALKYNEEEQKLQVNLSPITRAQLAFIEQVVLIKIPIHMRRNKAIELGLNLYHENLLKKERVCDIYIPRDIISKEQLKRIEKILDKWLGKRKKIRY